MKRPPIEDPVILLCCDNREDRFHGKTDLYLRYIFVDGVVIVATGIIDDFQFVLDEHPNAEVVIVTAPCPSCVKRGIRSPVDVFFVDRSDD